MQPHSEINQPRQTLTAADWRLLALAAAIVVFSCAFVWKNYQAAFPQASLNLKLSRAEVTARAEEFLGSRHWRVDGYRNLTLFQPDDSARLFLERELGLEEANRLMSAEVVVWQWRARWYRPPQKEEFRVWLAPDGRVVGFDHVVEEEASGGRLTREQARVIAQRAVPAGYRLVEEQTENRPNRIDHFFEWERENFNLRGATYRHQITVKGDEIGSSREYLKVPEQWQRDFAAMRSKNELYTQIAQAFYIPLILAGLVVLINGLRNREIRWGPIARACTVIAALMAVNQWNNLPFSLDALPTSTRLVEGVTLIFFQGIGAGVAVFFYVILAAAPGALLYRRRLPDKLPVGTALSARALDTREFFRASVSGYAMAAGHIAFITAFYLLGQRFGVWSPADVQYSDLLSTALPWLYPLTISLLAASSEEAWFRLLAVPLLARRRWLAILLPAFVWGFLHANYPQQPAWIRGVEVGLIGVVAALMMFRFGILSTLIWHYTVDAVLIGSYLFQAEGWYYRLTGALVAGLVLLPLAVSVVRYRRHGGFIAAVEEPPSMLREPPPEVPQSREELPPLRPTASPRLLFALAAVVGLALLLKPTRYGDFVRVHLTREQALAAAGPAPPGWRAVADFLPNLPVAEIEYLRRHGVDPTPVLQQFTFTGLWRVRFFQPLNRQERWVYLDSQRKMVREDHILGEQDAGANLSQADARALAQRYLGAQGVDFARLKEVDAATDILDLRTDHRFVWEDTLWKVSGARARVSLVIRGDRPSEYRRFLKLPEAWERDFRRVRLQRYLLPAMAGGLGLLLLVVFLRNLDGHPFQWRSYLTAGIAAAMLPLVSALNSYPSFWAGYQTSKPPGDYLADTLLSVAIRALLAGFAAAAGMLALDVFLHRRPRTVGSWAVAPAVVVLFGGALRLVAWGEQFIPGDRFSLPLWSSPPVEDAWPGLSVLLDAVIAAFAGTVAATIVIVVGIALLPPARRLGYGIGLALVIALARSDSPWLVLYTFLTTLALFGLVSVAVRCCGGAVTQLAAAIFLAQAAAGAFNLIGQPNPELRNQGAATLAAAFLATAAWLYRFRSRPSGVIPPGGP